MLLPHSRSSIANPRRHFVENRNMLDRKARVTSRLPNAGFSWLRKHHGSRAAMSALGQKQTSGQASRMSALPPKADIRPGAQNVRLVPKADIGSNAATRSPVGNVDRAEAARVPQLDELRECLGPDLRQTD